jgi:hypothetical protein
MLNGCNLDNKMEETPMRRLMLAAAILLIGCRMYAQTGESGSSALFVSAASDGTIYTTDISEGPGKECIAVARKVDGAYTSLERLGPPVNGEARSMYPCIAPDGSFLVFNQRRPGEKMQSVLVVSFRTPDGGWSVPRLIDLRMEAGTPFVSRDGKFLFFTAGERGKSDIYWVSAEVIEALRPKR